MRHSFSWLELPCLSEHTVDAARETELNRILTVIVTYPDLMVCKVIVNVIVYSCVVFYSNASVTFSGTVSRKFKAPWS